MPVPPLSTSSAKVVTNISSDGTVDFCQPILLSVQGGEGPYILSIAGTNFPTVNNFTLDASSDAAIFYNNITPNSLFIGEKVLCHLHLQHNFSQSLSFRE